MKLTPLFFSGIFSLVFAFSCQQGSGKKITYNLDNRDTPFVIIQLKEQDKHLDSLASAQLMKDVVDQVKAINSNLGYEPMEKKMASMTLTSKKSKTPILTIRNFRDFTEAEAYSYTIADKIPQDIYGEIHEPFPISSVNYKTCISENDFSDYYKEYSNTRK
jgi:hypothetical protein